MKYSPHDYQKHCISYLLSHNTAGLFLDPGLGKTSIVYATFDILQKMGFVRDCLVISPLRVAHSVWPRELQKWDDFQHLQYRILHNEGKDKIDEPHDISVINCDQAALRWLLEQDYSWDMLVIDESTKFKHTDTQRFKYLKKLLRKCNFKRRYILTGTPAPNGLMDLFGQIYILDYGASLGRFITHYRNEYFNQDPYTLKYELKHKAEKKINDKIAPLVIRMDAQDYVPLEPYLHNEIKVKLPLEAQAIYKKMENEFCIKILEENILAANSVTAGNKCRQIANGGIYNVDHEEFIVHEVKTEVVEDLVEELNGKPCLIAYEFEHDLHRLQAKFPSVPYLGGGVSAKKQSEIEDSWNAGLLSMLFVQPQSVAHGLNLQGVGAAIIFYGIPWNLEDYDQLIRRVWRQGQTERVVVHHIIAENTIDEHIITVLKQKHRTQKNLLDSLKTYAANQVQHSPQLLQQ